MTECTLIIVKPDGVQRRLVGRIVTRFEEKGLQLVAAKMVQISEEMARLHYAAHKDKPFFEPAVKFMCSGPSLVMIWQGQGVIDMSRKIIGGTRGFEAQPGTIRGDFGRSERYNLIHGSDSLEAAQREINTFFRPEDVFDYEFSDARWLFLREEAASS